jgi:hypothetical protein
MVRSGIYPNDTLRAACRERWALIVALMTGKTWREIDAVLHPRTPSPPMMVAVRDAVFAALADMVRCERAYWASAQAIYKALPDVDVSSDMQVVDPGDDDGDAPSTRWLAAYVAHIIERVGKS